MERSIQERTIYRLSTAIAPHLLCRSALSLATELEDCILVEAASTLCGVPESTLAELPASAIQVRHDIVEAYHIVLEGFLYNLRSQDPAYNNYTWWWNVNAMTKDRTKAGSGGGGTIVSDGAFFNHYRPLQGGAIGWRTIVDQHQLMNRYKQGDLGTSTSSSSSASTRNASSSSGAEGDAKRTKTRGGDHNEEEEGRGGETETKKNTAADYTFPVASVPRSIDEFLRVYGATDSQVAAMLEAIKSKSSGVDASPLLPHLQARRREREGRREGGGGDEGVGGGGARGGGARGGKEADSADGGAIAGGGGLGLGLIPSSAGVLGGATTTGGGYYYADQSATTSTTTIGSGGGGSGMSALMSSAAALSSLPGTPGHLQASVVGGVIGIGGEVEVPLQAFNPYSGRRGRPRGRAPSKGMIAAKPKGRPPRGPLMFTMVNSGSGSSSGGGRGRGRPPSNVGRGSYHSITYSGGGGGGGGGGSLFPSSSSSSLFSSSSTSATSAPYQQQQQGQQQLLGPSAATTNPSSVSSMGTQQHSNTNPGGDDGGSGGGGGQEEYDEEEGDGGEYDDDEEEDGGGGGEEGEEDEVELDSGGGGGTQPRSGGDMSMTMDDLNQ